MEHLPLSELIALFAGTEWTAPYPTSALARLICERSEPRNQTTLRHTIYGPEWPVEEIPTRELECLAQGYTVWRLTAARSKAA